MDTHYNLLGKKILRKLFKIKGWLLNRPKATGMVALSLAGAQAAYSNRPDIKIFPYYKRNDFRMKSPGHLPEDESIPSAGFTFPKNPIGYDAVLLEAKNPAFSFQYGHLVDDEYRAIYEPKVRFEELPIQHEYLVEGTKVAGTVAYLSNTVPNHYGHWIQAQLPLLMAYWEIFGKETIDYYYIGECPIVDFVEESLAKLGIRKEQIINYPCRADRSLIAVKYREIDKQNTMRTGFEMDIHSHRFLQQNLFQVNPSKTKQYARKLFITRGNVKIRRELNLMDVKKALEPHGFLFVSMDGKTMQEEANIFGHADVIIAVHGAALHNTIFAKPGTKVIEIFPYDYFDNSNYMIVNYSQCNYHYMLGEPISDTQRKAQKKLSYIERNKADIWIDPEKLIRLCQEIDIIASDPTTVTIPIHEHVLLNE